MLRGRMNGWMDGHIPPKCNKRGNIQTHTPRREKERKKKRANEPHEIFPKLNNPARRKEKKSEAETIATHITPAMENKSE